MRSLHLSDRFLILVCLVAAGCGESGPEMYLAHGVITYQSKPVVGATVTFIPEGKGGIGTAVTDDDGYFEIKSGEKWGVVAGKAAVTVTLFAKSGGGGVSSTMTPEQMQQMQMSGQLQSAFDGQSKSLIPARYGQAATSGLNVEVKSGQSEYNFTLE